VLCYALCTSNAEGVALSRELASTEHPHQEQQSNPGRHEGAIGLD